MAPLIPYPSRQPHSSARASIPPYPRFVTRTHARVCVTGASSASRPGSAPSVRASSSRLPSGRSSGAPSLGPVPVERRPRGCFPRRRPHCLLSAPPRRPRYPCRWERSLRGHTATGMRTMSVLCLGACCYCICSLFSFLDGPMAWDASRSSAAIPTGVGFLGATEPRRPPHRPPHIHEARTARPRCVRGMTRRCDHLEGQELVFWKGGVFVDATRSSRRVLRGRACQAGYVGA